jgi:sulfite reductase (NADPH) flavoprotein alpha-component
MSPTTIRYLLAFIAGSAYLALCAVTWLRARARRPAGSPPLAGDQRPMLVAFASQTGTAEELAQQTTRALETAGLPVTMRSFAQLDVAAILPVSEALLIVSTYGEGDAPDMAAALVARLQQRDVDLSTLHFGLLALGDRSYANFCGFGRQLDALLQERGAQPMFPRIDVDKSDELALQEWRHRLSHVVGTADLPDWEGPTYEAWTLRLRRHLNPGSLGQPIHHLELVPENAVSAHWEAGDLLQVRPLADPDRPREYSIASLPADGAAHLLVRLELRDDGSHGVASGWLTGQAAIGATVMARLRPHGNFRAGDNVLRDLILIGNGTGLAGLHAHLKQRAESLQSGAVRRHWLIFGERQAAHDALYADDLDAWRRDGLLTHLDLVYSRDGQADRYVQDRLRNQATRLRDWIRDGAALYVCGSLQGMAADVDAALREILGAPVLESLTREGRYRRDVY